MKIIMIFFSVLFCAFANTTSVAQALKNHSFLGRWKVVAVDIDGSRMNAPYSNSFLEFKEGRYVGFLGCNNFFGNYGVIEQRHVTIASGGATKKMCESVLSNFEMNFLRFFYGDFLSKKVQGFLLLKNERMQIWLKRFENYTMPY